MGTKCHGSGLSVLWLARLNLQAIPENRLHTVSQSKRHLRELETGPDQPCISMSQLSSVYNVRGGWLDLTSRFKLLVLGKSFETCFKPAFTDCDPPKFAWTCVAKNRETWKASRDAFIGCALGKSSQHGLVFLFVLHRLLSAQAHCAFASNVPDSTSFLLLIPLPCTFLGSTRRPTEREKWRKKGERNQGSQGGC